MKLVEKVKINYNLELTDEEINAFRGIKKMFDNLTIEEWEQLCTYIAYVMGDADENYRTVDQNIDIFCEYLSTLPL